MNIPSNAQETPLLSMVGIAKNYPGVTALSGVDLEVRRGEVHVLLGENGAGKSTLIRILSGAVARDAGTIRVDGETVEIDGPRRAQEVGIATIHQEFNLVPHLSVAANIFLGHEPAGPTGWIRRTTLHDQTRALLQELDADIAPGTPVAELGVAEQQMVEVAKALSLNARILVMDEPTSALTQRECAKLFQVIRRLQRKGVGMIYISHRLEEIFEIGDRVTVLRDGCFVDRLPVRKASVQGLVRLMANRDLAEHYPRVRVQPGKDRLRVEGLSLEGAFTDISFSVQAGEIVGLSGLVGAGRTALVRSLFGLQPPQRGQVWVDGRAVHLQSPREAIRAGIGLLTEDRKQEGLVLGQSVMDNLALPSLKKFTNHGLIDRARLRSACRVVTDQLKIKLTSLDQPALSLSGGNQQKVVLGKWLLGQPGVLVFDEPTRGIDVGSKVEIYRIMNQLTEQGSAILMVSSELPEILGISDRILVMSRGRLVAEHPAGATQEALLASALEQPLEARGAQ